MQKYKEHRADLYSDEGITVVLEVLDRVREATRRSGCCKAGSVMSGSTFLFHNAVDWLVERKRIRVLLDDGMGQDMVLEAVCLGE